MIKVTCSQLEVQSGQLMMTMTLSDQLAPDGHEDDDDDDGHDDDDNDNDDDLKNLIIIILTDELVSDLCGVGALSEEDILLPLTAKAEAPQN